MAFGDTLLLVDDFERVDGPVLAGAGATIWAGAIDSATAPNSFQIFSGRATASGAPPNNARTVASYGPDVDYVANIAQATEYLALFFALAGAGGSGWSGYALTYNLSAANVWEFRKYTAGAGTIIAGSATQAVIVNDMVGLSMRGNVLAAHYKPAGGVWAQVLSITDATYNRAGPIGVEPGSTGGTFLWDLTAATIAPPGTNPTAVDSAALGETSSVQRTEIHTATDTADLADTDSLVTNPTGTIEGTLSETAAVSVAGIAKPAADAGALSEVAGVTATPTSVKTASDAASMAEAASVAAISPPVDLSGNYKWTDNIDSYEHTSRIKLRDGALVLALNGPSEYLTDAEVRYLIKSYVLTAAGGTAPGVVSGTPLLIVEPMMSASGMGAVIGRYRVVDLSGNHIGYVPVYAS